MDLTSLFSDAGACMLMPSVDQGPLCWSSQGFYAGETFLADTVQTFKGIRCGRTLLAASPVSP